MERFEKPEFWKGLACAVAIFASLWLGVQVPRNGLNMLVLTGVTVVLFVAMFRSWVK